MAVQSGHGSQVSKSGAKDVSSQFSASIVQINGQISSINQTRVQFLKSDQWSGEKKNAFDRTFCVFVNNLISMDNEANNGLSQYNTAMNTRFSADGQTFKGDDAPKCDIQSVDTQLSEEDSLVADFDSIQQAIEGFRQVVQTFKGIVDTIKTIINVVKAVWIDVAAEIFLNRLQKLVQVVQKALEELDRAATALDERLTEVTTAVQNAQNTVEGISQFTQAFDGMY
jgi:uncharacterized protein YukE